MKHYDFMSYGGFIQVAVLRVTVCNHVVDVINYGADTDETCNG